MSVLVLCILVCNQLGEVLEAQYFEPNCLQRLGWKTASSKAEARHIRYREFDSIVFEWHIGTILNSNARLFPKLKVQ